MYFLKKFFLKTKGTQDKDIKIAWSKKLPVDRTKIRCLNLHLLFPCQQIFTLLNANVFLKVKYLLKELFFSVVNKITALMCWFGS